MQGTNKSVQDIEKEHDLRNQKRIDLFNRFSSLVSQARNLPSVVQNDVEVPYADLVEWYTRARNFVRELNDEIDTAYNFHIGNKSLEEKLDSARDLVGLGWEYTHVVTGNVYVVLDVALRCEDDAIVVVYRRKGNASMVFTRELGEWQDRLRRNKMVLSLGGQS